MELYLFPVLALLLIVCGRETDGYGPLAAQVYWKSMLPATPLPHALQLLLTSDAEIRSSFADGLLTIAVSSRVRYRTSYWAESKAFHKSKSTFNTTTTTTYFLQHNLHPNTKMSNVIFIKSPKGFNFLPRKLAQSIPFSTSKLPEILNLTSIKSISKEAQIIKQTIQDCEAPGMEGEDKHCVTSLESLVDYVVMKFGTRVQTASNQVEEEKKKQDYIIQEGIKMMEEKNHNMICHKEKYAYAVYYCHIINDTNVYMISMRGIDESRAEAAVVCHLDTSAWNPNHYAFQVLKVKPGGLPVCHFLNSDTIVWSPILGYIMPQFIGEIL